MNKTNSYAILSENELQQVVGGVVPVLALVGTTVALAKAGYDFAYAAGKAYYYKTH